MATHSARAALARFRLDQARRSDRRRRHPDLIGQFEHPGPHFLGVLNPVPRSVAQDDEIVCRPNPQFPLGEQKVQAYLSLVPQPERSGGLC
jgi:hypothetical protein